MPRRSFASAKKERSSRRWFLKFAISSITTIASFLSLLIAPSRLPAQALARVPTKDRAALALPSPFQVPPVAPHQPA